MTRPARSHRRSTRGGLPLSAVLIALMAAGPVSGVAPLAAIAVSPNAPPISEEESDAKTDKLTRPARPLVGPPPARPARPAARPRAVVHKSHPAPTPPYLSSAHGLDGPHLRC